MAKVLGNPKRPCAGIKRSKGFLEEIERGARENIRDGLTDKASVDEGMRDLKADTVKYIGMACSELCPKLGRCMLESFGPNDPLLDIPVSQLNPDQSKELAAKRQFYQLRYLTKQALGFVLF